jgi:putative endonuclease
MYRVYVLQNLSGRRYIGLSEDPTKRLAQHNAGLSRWTSAHGPWRIVWLSEPMSLSDARKLENKLKSQKGGHGFEQVTGLARRSS